MNYLGHQFLSPNQDYLRIGNFIGDFVKGKQYLNYPEEIQKGILLHREIDHFADTHKTSLEAKKLLYPYFGKYAGVALDLYFDYYLQQHWKQYTTANKEEFTKNIYRIITSYKSHFNAELQRFSSAFVVNDLLHSCKHKKGLIRTGNHIESKTKYSSNLGEIGAVLEKEGNEIESLFFEYIEAAKKHFLQ